MFRVWAEIEFDVTLFIISLNGLLLGAALCREEEENARGREGKMDGKVLADDSLAVVVQARGSCPAMISSSLYCCEVFQWIVGGFKWITGTTTMISRC